MGHRRHRRLPAPTLAVLGALAFSCLAGEERPRPRLAPMPVGRHTFVAAAIDGRIYCVGGSDGAGGQTRALHAYDIAANSWSEKAPWPTPSAYPCGAAVGGKLYVVGGP